MTNYNKIHCLIELISLRLLGRQMMTHKGDIVPVASKIELSLQSL